MSDIFKEIREIDPNELERHGVIQPARKLANGKPTYICPICENGTGDDGTGITVKPHPDGVVNYHCFKCGKNFTAVDLIALRIGADGKMSEVAEWAKKHFGLKGDKFLPSTEKSDDAKSSTNEPSRSEHSKLLEELAFPNFDKFKSMLEPADRALLEKYLSLDEKVLKSYGLGKNENENEFFADTLEAVAYRYFSWTWGLCTAEKFPYEDTMKEIFAKAKEILGDDPKTNYKNLIEVSRLNLKKFVADHGEKYRGLTFKELEKFGCGYMAELFQAGKTPRFIIPTSYNHFFARLTIPVDELPADKKTSDFGLKPKLHFGQKEIFGLKISMNALKNNSAQFVIVVEGEFDAMSVDQCGFTAISFSGSEISAHQQGLLKQFPQGTKFILSFDGDDTGKKNTQKVIDAIKSCGYFAIGLTLSNKYKDANDFLQADEGGLKNRLREMTAKAEEDYKVFFENKLKTEGLIPLADYLDSGDFYSEINAAAQYSGRKSGFENLDLKQAWLPGLYVLGGLPGLGKTALAIQLLEQFARNGETCVYCSLEMSKTEIMSRIFARTNYQGMKIKWKGNLDLEKIFSTTYFRSGKFNREYNGDNEKSWKESLHNRVVDSVENFYIWELEDQNIDKIIEGLEKICDCAEFPPIVVIDYLQMIKTEKDTAKMAIDDIVRKLKNFQRRTNAMIIVISSFNRDGYDADVNFKSFKESGGIEYTADVVFGLQLKLEAGEDKEAAKKRLPRKIQLKCLKNRHGENYDVEFDYFAKFDTFEPEIISLKVDGEEVTDCW